MKKLFITTIFVVVAFSTALGWGRVGHFITADIAEKNLTEKANAEIQRILGDMDLRGASVWMDEVRRTDEYRHTADWHWVTVPDGQTYEQSEKNPNGDIIEELERHIAKLKAGGLSEKKERDALLYIIHLVGDIHQPLHVGREGDRGGNDVRIVWEMGRSNNLHSLWDTGMILTYNKEPEEFARELNPNDAVLIEKWQSASVRDWAVESISHREAVYSLPPDNRLGKAYRDEYFHLVELRLAQAGVRIAGVLNSIFQ